MTRTAAAPPALHRQVTGHDPGHLPPMGVSWLTPLYDPVTRLIGAGRVHRGLVGAAGVRPGHRVLEIGCGTGNLALLVKERQPAATVVGLDPDFAALARAQRKARRRGLDVQWDSGSATRLPYPDGSVDRVLSSLMLHHVPPDEKLAALREARRVLATEGELHLADFGGGHPQHGPFGRMARSSRRLRDQAGDGLVALLREAGFADVEETVLPARLLGPLIACRARR